MQRFLGGPIRDVRNQIASIPVLVISLLMTSLDLDFGLNKSVQILRNPHHSIFFELRSQQIAQFLVFSLELCMIIISNVIRFAHTF